MGKGHKLFSYKMIRSEDLMCTMIRIVDNIVYLIFAKRVELKYS